MKDPRHRLELAGCLALEKVEVVECEKLPRARRPHSCVVASCDYYVGNSHNGSAGPVGLGDHMPVSPPPVVPARSGRVVTLACGGIFAVTGSPIRFYDASGEYLYSLEEAGHIRGGRITLLQNAKRNTNSSGATVIATLNRDRRLMTWSISPGGSVQYLASFRLNLNSHRYRSGSPSRSPYPYSNYDYSGPFAHAYGEPNMHFSNAHNHGYFHSISHSHHPTEMISVGAGLLLIGDNLGNVHLISHSGGRNLRSINIQLTGIHTEKICYLAANESGNKFAVSSKDGIISVWAISKNNIIHCIGRLPTVWGSAYRIDMNDHFLVAAGNGELRVYDFNSASIGISKIITNAYDHGATSAPNAYGDGNGNMNAPENDHSTRSPILKIFGKQWVIVGGGGKTLSILNIQTAKAISTILTPFDRVRALDFTKDNKLVVTSVDTGGLALLDMRIPRNVHNDLHEWTKSKFGNNPANHQQCAATNDETSNEDDNTNINIEHNDIGDGNEDADFIGNGIDRALISCRNPHTDANSNSIENDIDSRDRRRRVLQATSSIAIAALGCFLLKCGRRFLSRT